MISFIVCLALLITGYLTYGKIVDNTFGPDDRETPAVRINDGVDYVVMPQWKLFLVQLLNIAGLGPIFGALQGALWGPVVFLWITFGTIFAGGVHDYFSGMISERNDGASIAEVTGKYLGPVMQNVMRVFSVVLLIMVGTVFAVGPAGLIVTLCKNSCGSGDLHERGFLHVLHPCAGMPRQPAEQQDGGRRGYLQHRSRIPHRYRICHPVARAVHPRDKKAWHEEKSINDRIRCSRPFVLFDRLQSSAEVIEVTENDVQTLSARFRAHR